jgi:murein DD-endopeptidase MepM/ murein hydrolase activator NlpD
LRVCTASAALSVALLLALEASAYPASPGAVRDETVVFAVPLEGPLFERFGYARGRLHAGIDIAVLRTDAVRAALAGQVTVTGYLPQYSGYGKVVKLRHAGRVVTMYAHLASARVKAGQWVERGEVIARAGCTGSCTGTHLHFEVRVRGKLVDPLRYLKGRVR